MTLKTFERKPAKDSVAHSVDWYWRYRLVIVPVVLYLIVFLAAVLSAVGNGSQIEFSQNYSASSPTVTEAPQQQEQSGKAVLIPLIKIVVPPVLCNPSSCVPRRFL